MVCKATASLRMGKLIFLKAHGNKCAVCGKRFNGRNYGDFDAHHLTPQGRESFDVKSTPAYKFRSFRGEELVNLVCECIPVCKHTCHHDIHAGRAEAKPLDINVVRCLATYFEERRLEIRKEEAWE